MFNAHYNYKCSCKTNPLHGDLKTSESAAQQILGILDQSWADTHNRPSCTPAAEARTITHRGKRKEKEPLKSCRDASKSAELVEGAILTAPADCPCGKAPLPWHLVAIADKRMSHVCSCRNGYAWASETTMRYLGKRSNPIADFDEAQASKAKTAARAGS